ncbi:unnamed protein product [Rotaria sordida]|uniref:DGCR14 n=1 Tax=Rotaria sordida TaxID=392033 RepID=A0A818ZRR6_9BILA|nr:unnamed protein product [Rotaria sordida]CAF1270886.1 unnamed protein product [Rotaria sordida]CAF1356959.1 unnamed protein product [Rotaria sordida]CAF1432831.1 unnamed protein product [Rotaria sordida]CAF1633192.1 unnamed protein product [Rotaria sordida]
MIEDTSKTPPLISSSTPTPTRSNPIKDIDVFRKPLPPAPLGQQTPSSRRQKRKILEEEKFVQDLAHIIERDFFPDIKRLRAKEKYLTALEKNDVVTLRDLYAKYSIHRGPTPSPSMMGHRDTPSSSFETPIDSGRDTPKTMKDDKVEHDELLSKRTDIDEDDEDFDKQSVSSKLTTHKKVRDLRLDQYLAMNTSEDNISFEHVMEETQKKDRTKVHQAWLYEQQALTHSSTESGRVHELPVPSIEDQAKTNNPDSSEFWPYTVKNAVMYFPEGAKLTAAEKIEQAKHVRSIYHKNTRFEIDSMAATTTATNSSSHTSTPARPNALLRPQIDIDGREIKRLESPKVSGYGFVVTPSPMPGAHGDESPMMTWGQIEGTPFCLDAGNETPRTINNGPQFKIIETPLREQLALELVEKNAAQHRKKKVEAMKTINKNFSSTNNTKQTKELLLSTMSPAAQRLLTNRLGIQRTQSTNTQRQNVLTPSPVVRTSDRTPRPPLNIGIIKHSPRTPSTPTITTTGNSLTDNLLNLK